MIPLPAVSLMPPAQSPLAALLTPAQREATADIVNAALLRSAAPRGGSEPQAGLERVLQQLVAVQVRCCQCRCCHDCCCCCGEGACSAISLPARYGPASTAPFLSVPMLPMPSPMLHPSPIPCYRRSCMSRQAAMVLSSGLRNTCRHRLAWAQQQPSSRRAGGRSGRPSTAAVRQRRSRLPWRNELGAALLASELCRPVY